MNKIKGRGSSETQETSNSGSGEQRFGILPHPAKTNDPRDVEGPQLGGGLNSNPEVGAFHARDPHVPSQQIANNLEKPLSREELRARAAELNK
ncbi:hypothetical protein PUNSTDRAFT_76036 [Punctularia strigosozonata HHB-11173 SS5]|uniref:Uncharacterized protein n=1 Tax=Punctularia strigosozonata (strain HHB-11173) TaxID=741275 RepID=R7S345_PUNST|nr:uncharacterized protein PUNSTDRAFT_76036 [Punctularia strigosozonata HHB-11173 SS5]EIN04648.1 hypothetical protein PUNSTDRAFT_76036 [Punctularia strigosozonata HHB-11173 SS5]